MNNLNIGWWNTTKLHIFKLNNLQENDMVISAKLKIKDLVKMADLEELELIYCGTIMENTEKISNYVKEKDALVFMIIKKNDNIVEKTETTKDLQKMFNEYNEAFSKFGFKEMLLSYIKPEIITELVNAIPELSEDLVALSIIKDISVFETTLKPSVMKIQLTKHPTLLMSVYYLMHNVMKDIHGRLLSSIHLTDEDYSESDDIEIDYNQPNVSGFESNNISELAFLIHNNNISRSNEDGGVIETLFQSNLMEDVLIDVLDDPSDQTGQQFVNNSSGLASQLHQMHELGLFNDLLNFRALQIAGGNVQQAVELILNGVIE
ncbi:uncharacterized protein LOC123675247 [Harmonia axyridis]|uniref:uncharacterized protein LOC123675247 n=1 Tax=Harmonia axyridis TaxID=115357 RepID=UPI001E276F9B|nr:uncharacterized protein LOC123675247 [Harmonia axyridis]